jgi:hypothetical protein
MSCNDDRLNPMDYVKLSLNDSKLIALAVGDIQDKVLPQLTGKIKEQLAENATILRAVLHRAELREERDELSKG